MCNCARRCRRLLQSLGYELVNGWWVRDGQQYWSDEYVDQHHSKVAIEAGKQSVVDFMKEVARV